MADVKTKTESIINENWTKTPDMSEYLDNDMIIDIAKKMLDGKDGGQYFLENPFSEQLGYHEAENVFVISSSKVTVTDGDTVGTKYDYMEDGGRPFIFAGDGLEYPTVKNFLYNTMGLSTTVDKLGIRILGVNAPEIPHCRVTYVPAEPKIIYAKFGDLMSNTNITTYNNPDDKIFSDTAGTILNKYKTLDRANFSFVYFDYTPIIDKKTGVVDLEYANVRKDDKYVTFLVINSGDKEVYYEIIEKDVELDETYDNGNKIPLPIYAICFLDEPADGKDRDQDYHKQSLDAKAMLEDMIKGATAMLFVLDGTTFKQQKDAVPEEYRGDAIRMSDDPSFALEYLYNQATNTQGKAYTRLGYDYFGQDFNRRGLGAMYIKSDDPKYGSGLWINVAKFLASQFNEYVILPSYSSSPANESNFNYNSGAFKMWSYDKNAQIYVDEFNDFHSEHGGDDREKIQRAITGSDMSCLKEYTALIGDCLLMVPPTSIRLVSQTNSQRTSLIRAKGAITKTIPKSERIIEMQLYFNGDAGINGVPYEETLPTGETMKYYMNGLRALIAQFKFTPYLPITNNYINQVLNIEAVSLSSIQISTVPNFPRTIQATIRLQDFEYRQFMPEILPPNIDKKEDLTTNLFAQTIHFPVMRYYYQRAIQNGEAAILLDYNSEPYLEATLGQKTVLQPMKFKSPLIDFYIANEEHLKMRKQLKEALEKKPFETVVTYTADEKAFLAKIAKMNSAVVKTLAVANDDIKKINAVYNADTDYYSPYLERDIADYNFDNYIAGEYDSKSYKGEKGFYFDGISPTAFFNKYLAPLENNLKKIFEDKTTFDTSIIKDYGIVIRESKVLNSDTAINLMLGLKLIIDWSKCSPDILRKVKQEYAKSFAISTDTLLVDDAFTVGFSVGLVYKDTKTTKSDSKTTTVQYSLTGAFNIVAPGSFDTYTYIDADTNLLDSIANDYGLITDEKGNVLTDTLLTGDELFQQNQALAAMKDSMDLETSKSMLFDPYPIENCIVENVSIIYNNNFNKMSLTSMDGYVSQYIGASDTSIEINIKTKDKTTISNLQSLPRNCVDRLINYRKIMTCSPLRIDCEMARLAGINEVIVESVDINTVPNFPGLYSVSIRLTSVDRTLRNREALKKIDVDTSHTNNDNSILSKNFFDFQNVLSKVELYPDLELPTLSELERLGYYFIRYKNEQGRVFPDADFYFVYLHAYSSEMFRKSIVTFFSDPANDKLMHDISGDLYGDEAQVSLNLTRDEKVTELITDLGGSSAYAAEIQKVYDDAEKSLSGSAPYASKEITDHVSAKQKQNVAKTKIILDLQESLEASSYSTYDFNHQIKVSIKDSIPYDEASHIISGGNTTEVMDDGSLRKDVPVDDVIKTTNEGLKKLIKRLLNKPITTGDSKNIMPEDMYNLINYITEDILAIGPVDKAFKAFTVNGDKLDSGTPISKNTNPENQYVITSSVPYFMNHKLRTALSSAATGRASVLDFDKDDKTKKIDEWIGTSTVQAIKADGTKYNTRNILTTCDGQGMSDYVIAETDEEVANGLVYGPFAIKKYDPKYLGAIYKSSILSGEHGFLDPYYNRSVYNIFYKKEIEKDPSREMKADQEATRIAEYIKGISDETWDNKEQVESFGYASIAMYRIMLVWFYKLLDDDKQSFLPASFYYLKNVTDILNGDNSESAQDANSIMSSVNNPLMGFWNLSKGIMGYGASFLSEENTFRREVETRKEDDDANAAIQDKLEQMKKDLKEALPITKINLVCGLFTTLGALAIGEFNTPIYEAIVGGNLSEYSNYIESMKASYLNYNKLNKTDLIMRRFFSYLDFDEYNNKNAWNKRIDPLKKYSTANKSQRMYLKAAEIPKIYLMHSFYDMVMHDMRGRMARAFPTYYMLLIDEGRDLGMWHLQDNFYDTSSISEFQVVKSRKIAADTANIMMTNLFGTFTSEDEDMKDEYQYTFRDAWNSIFSPRDYYTKEFTRRTEARDFNRAKLKPGARVHLRMGYEGDASRLPILFNGAVAEVATEGDMMNVICQGDGVELANPDMFNAADADTVADLKYTENMLGGLYGLFNEHTTPRDLLINPLTSSGTWIKSLIKDWSNSRFFNDNPFGIVHFGDKYYKEVFLTNGEMEQNIYEAINKPSWGTSGETSCNESLWAMETSPKIKVGLEGGKSYWDLMGIAASVSPEHIAAVVPFNLRSSIFYGAPRYYCAYDYAKTIDGKIVEKRKPFQQYHIYTSHTDIIGNKIAASDKEIRTVAVGIYKGDDWLSASTQTVGPMYLDIDIYPENQKMTTINCNFEHKSFDLPFTIPVAGKLTETFTEEGYKTAWRATANGLKNTVKDMYTGELIVMGDPAVKPYDKMFVYDTYQDMQGMFEIETVVQTFSVDTGFTTSLAPDCVVAVDDKYEKIAHSTIKAVALPVIANFITVATLSARFANITRSLYFSAAQSVSSGVKFSENIVNSIKTMAGADELATYSGVADGVLGKLGSAFSATASDYLIYSSISTLEKAYKALPTSHSFASSTDLVKFFEDIQGQSAALSKIDPMVLKTQLQEALKDTSILQNGLDLKAKQKIENAITKCDEYIASIGKAKATMGNVAIDAEYIQNIIAAVPKDKYAEEGALKTAMDYLETIKDSKVVAGSANFDEAIANLIVASNNVDDFTEEAGATADLLKSLKTLDKTVFEASTVSLENFGTLGKTFAEVNTVRKGAGALKALVSSNLIWLAAQVVLTKYAQEYIERKLKNLQVLTVFPVMKNNLVMTAGLNGNKGSVFDSPTYSQPGFIEDMAAKFFDGKYGSVYPFVLECLVDTTQMKETVNSYKRDSAFGSATSSTNAEKADLSNKMVKSVVKQEVSSVDAYKQLFLVPRVGNPISQEGRVAYKNNCFLDVSDPSTDARIEKELVYIFQEGDMQLLNAPSDNSRQVLLFSAQQESNSKDASGNAIGTIEMKVAPATLGTEGSSVRCKKIEQGDGILPVYDIPFLRPDARHVLTLIVQSVALELQPDALAKTSTLENLHAHNIIIHNATRLNEKSSWSNTGYSFTIQVKGYDGFGNILKKLHDEQEIIIKDQSTPTRVFNYKEDTSMGDNTYTVMISPAL
jgi:hypothetical protein